MTPEQNATRLVQKFTPYQLDFLTPKQAQQIGIMHANLHVIETISEEMHEVDFRYAMDTLSAIKSKYGK